MWLFHTGNFSLSLEWSVQNPVAPDRLDLPAKSIAAALLASSCDINIFPGVDNSA